MTSGHLYEQIARNKRNSIFLIVAMTCLLVAIGFVFGSYYGDALTGLLLAGGFALLFTVISYFSGGSLVMTTMGAKKIQKQDNPQLFNVVEEMSIAAGLPMPAIYVINSNASNAFATGRSPEKSAIAVTTGLLEILKRDELQGVIGHEMAHIKNYDTRFAILMAVMVGAIAMLCDASWRIMRGTKSRSSSKGGGQSQLIMLAIAIILAILAPIAAKVIQFAMSRRRELLADNTSAELTRNPDALARALEKIAADPDPLSVANRGTQHLFFTNPVRAAKDAKRIEAGKPVKEKAGWFDTHPPISERVQLLKEMAHTMS